MRRVILPLNVTASAIRSAASDRDYYELLGISRNASAQDVKKAYRKRAMETHPDQGGNSDDFAAVGAAYEVLSNPEKRAVYDAHGKEGLEGLAGGAGGPSRNPADIFADFFGGGFGGQRAREPERAEDLEVEVGVTLEELFKGVTKTVRFTRPVACKSCRGHGTKSGDPKPKCKTCKGAGQVMQQHESMGMMGHVVTACPACQGSGKRAAAGDTCGSCGGHGRSEEPATWDVKIPAGMPAENGLVEHSMGGRAVGLQNGHLFIRILIAPHPTFVRRGNDLVCEMRFTLAEALLGVERTIKLLDGVDYTVRLPKSPLPLDAVLRIAGKGLPSMEGGSGDVYITTTIEMPSTLTEAQRKAISEAFVVKSQPAPSGAPALTAAILPGGRQRVENMTREAGGGTRHRGDGRRKGRSSGGGTECQVQ